MKRYQPKPKGFAVMHPDRVREIATMGGMAVSRNSAHMAEIGAIGGASTQRTNRRARKIAGRK